jgi:hypothetical protein
MFLNRFSNISKRDRWMMISTVLTFIIYLICDPDSDILPKLPFGASTIATFLPILKASIIFMVLHWSRKVLFDYVDFKELYNKAKQSSAGSGLFSVAFAIVIYSLSYILAAVVKS